MSAISNLKGHLKTGVCHSRVCCVGVMGTSGLAKVPEKRLVHSAHLDFSVPKMSNLEVPLTKEKNKTKQNW